MPPCQARRGSRAWEMERKPPKVCCDDCYFHRAGLCALQLPEACPTFRRHTDAALAREHPVWLTPRPLAEVVRAQVVRSAAAAA